LPALTRRPVDHSTIRNSWPAKEVSAGDFNPAPDAGRAMKEVPKDDGKGNDRRGVQRTKVLRNAKIIVPRRSPVIHCTVQNITSVGACLKLANTFGVPATFDLTFEHGRTRRACRVVWRTHDKLGVTFRGAAANEEQS
jgi:hypothetical protein